MANDEEELGYVSTSPFLTMPVTVKPKDEADQTALQGIQSIIDNQIKYYSDVVSLSVDESIFTVKQQLAVNQGIVAGLNQAKLLVDTTLTNIKEKYNG